jgi:membrane-bound lytic murein transglycosylase D
METRAWWCQRTWLCFAALAIATAFPHPAAPWGGEPLSPAALSSDSQRVAAVPKPPLPPPLPAGLVLEAEGGDDTLVLPVPLVPEPIQPTPVPLPALVFDSPLFDDPRADIQVSLAPGIPVPTYPIVVNATVEAIIGYFTERERERFGVWISRSGRYLGMIRRIFKERGLPEELAYTAMIESGFSPRAVSRVGAKGLWQFMEATARRYGLVVNRWVDERFDPVKSTMAAAQYLGDLHGMFGHWFLAQAAYNAGEAKVERAIQRAKTSDFWALTQTRHLPNETKRFVPQILAATVITRAPARYGFEVAMESPLAYDEITVKRVLDFETIAALAGVSEDEVRELNPALRGGVTPPFGSYVLKLPHGTGARFESALEEASPARLTGWGLHRVARNQSLAEIARLYRTTPQRLAEVNQLRGGRLKGVNELLVPVSRRITKVQPARVAAREGDRPASRTP